MLKTVVLLMFVDFFSEFFGEQKVKKNSIYSKYIFCNKVKVFAVTFDQLNASLLKKINNNLLKNNLKS